MLSYERGDTCVDTHLVEDRPVAFFSDVVLCWLEDSRGAEDAVGTCVVGIHSDVYKQRMFKFLRSRDHATLFDVSFPPPL